MTPYRSSSMTVVNSGPDDQHSAGELLQAQAEFREAYANLHRIEPDSELLKHAGFEYTAVHDIQGFKERSQTMRERTQVMTRRKSLNPRSSSGS